MSTPTTIQPIENAKETLLGMTLALEQRFGCQPRNDKSTTLNAKFSVFQDRDPVNDRLVQWFCMGVKGRANDNTTLSSAQFTLGTNFAPYGIRPFRCVPVEDDISAEERKNYAMRVIKNINGQDYVLYYLKRIDFTKTKVQYIRTDPASGNVSDYNLDPAGLNPTPPTADSNGVISDVSDSISVMLPGSCTITGEELLESVAVIDGGDMRYAVISELGFVSGSAEQVQVANHAGIPFAYEEAMMAQMTDHYTWVGSPLMSTSDSWTRTLNFSLKNLTVNG